jgi:hypothetical protein
MEKFHFFFLNYGIFLFLTEDGSGIFWKKLKSPIGDFIFFIKKNKI